MRTIIHEDTHGFLCTKGFEYTPKNRVQTEKICGVEENRFFTKLDYEFKDQLIKPFDEKDWNFSWHASKWNQMKALLQRLKQSAEKKKSNYPNKKSHNHLNPVQYEFINLTSQKLTQNKFVRVLLKKQYF